MFIMENKLLKLKTTSEKLSVYDGNIYGYSILYAKGLKYVY